MRNESVCYRNWSNMSNRGRDSSLRKQTLSRRSRRKHTQSSRKSKTQTHSGRNGSKRRYEHQPTDRNEVNSESIVVPALVGHELVYLPTLLSAAMQPMLTVVVPCRMISIY